MQVFRAEVATAALYHCCMAIDPCVSVAVVQRLTPTTPDCERSKPVSQVALGDESDALEVQPYTPTERCTIVLLAMPIVRTEDDGVVLEGAASPRYQFWPYAALVTCAANPPVGWKDPDTSTFPPKCDGMAVKSKKQYLEPVTVGVAVQECP